jgi:hypothetical protein
LQHIIAEERARQGEVPLIVLEECGERAGRRGVQLAQRLIGQADVLTRTGQPTRSLGVPPRLAHRGQRAGQVKIITAEHAHQLAGRVRQRGVEGLARVVAAMLKVGQLIAVTFEDVQARIGRAPIDDDVLQPGIRLIQHAANGLFEELALIEAGGDDRQCRLVGHDRSRDLNSVGCHRYLSAD